MNIFKKQKRAFGPTKKKKNTYIVNLDVLGNLTLWEMCQSTPLPVVILNGQEMETSNGWMESAQFPNPMAQQMIRAYRQAKPVIGQKAASTIIEYLDKETGEPIAMLFPHTTQLCTRGVKSYEELTQRLNHATRRDLERQLEMRNRLIAQVNMAKAR